MRRLDWTSAPVVVGSKVGLRAAVILQRQRRRSLLVDRFFRFS